MDVEPSMLSNVEDAVAWYGDTAVPRLADASGFCATLLYADWSSGRLISETVWQDPQALAASRSTATAGEAAGCGGTERRDRRLRRVPAVFSSARPA